MLNAQAVVALDDAAFARWVRKPEKFFAEREREWRFWHRPEQVPPSGDWSVWLVMAGRGFGKTRAGAEWVRAMAEADGSLHIALVGATLNEARAIMVEGESGLLAIAPVDNRPTFEPSLRRLKWDNGAVATLYSAGEPESLRGPQHHIAWCDEIGKWDRGAEAWDMLGMTLRVGSSPRIVATTTPRPVPLVKRLLTQDGVVVTRGRSADNRMNLSPGWFAAMRRVHGGTRLGRQELDGELLDDIEGALFARDRIEAWRVATPPPLRRVVIGVDPPASVGGDACGIVAAGLGEDGCAYVLGDHSVSGATPEGWARAVAGACAAWDADRVIAEANNGGAMIESVLRGADLAMPVRRVHASRGKTARAEPVLALFEAGRAFFAGCFAALEDELCGIGADGRYQGPGRSPDRADAAVWALTELMLGKGRAEARVRVL